VRARLRARIDPGLIVVLLLTALAAWPLLTRPGLPTATDADLHIYRTQQIMTAWGQGVLYARWAPDMAYGFGYPVFNYYAPLTYYLGAAYGRLCCGATGGAVAGVKFVLAASAFAGALGMYLFGRDQWDGAAGVVSAAAFVLAPYSVYLDPLARGAAPETFALGLMPLILWAFARLRRAPTPGRLTLAALSFAALLLTHNLMSFVLTGLLVAWLVYPLPLPTPLLFGGCFAISPWERGEGRLNPAFRRSALAALLLGTGLAACMWLPAWLERGAVQYQRAFAEASRPDAQLQFVDAGQLLAPVSLADLADPRVSGWKFRLGPAQWALGLLGLLSISRARPRRGAPLFFAVVAAVLTGLVLPASAPLWRAIPLLTYLQLPWRLLGPAAVALGVLAGAALNWAPPGARLALGSVAVAACIVGAMPLLNPLPWADYGPVTPGRLWQFERAGNVGTTAQNEFLPIGVTEMPEPQESLQSSYATGQVDKVQRADLPTETQVSVLEHGPEYDRFHISGPAEFDLTLFTFDFPGWTAYVDGERTPITASAPNGFIRLHVPAGNHTVLVRLENSPARWLGWGISAVAALILLGLMARHRRSLLSDEPRPSVLEDRTLSLRGAAWFGVVVVIGLVSRLIADRNSPWEMDTPDPAAPQAQYEQLERLEGNMALLAYDLPQVTAHPGESLLLTLYWRARGRVPLDLSVFIHVIGPDGGVWGQSDKVRPVADFPTDRWPSNQIMVDAHQVFLRPDAPPGRYTVRVGLWDRTTGSRRHVLDSDNAATEADAIVLTTSFTIQP